MKLKDAYRDDYVSAIEFARMVGCGKTSVRRVAEAARVRINQLPGLAPRYHVEDIRRIMASSQRIAGMTDDHSVKPEQTMKATAG